MNKLYWMYVVIPSGVDNNIVFRVINKYYRGWMLIDRLENNYSYNIILKRECSSNRLVKPNMVEVCIDRISEASVWKSIEYGRAMLRQHILWRDDAYVLYGKGVSLENYIVHPAFDIFIWRSGFETQVLESKKVFYGSNPLVHKKFGGEHVLYSGFKQVAKLVISDNGSDFEVQQLSTNVLHNNLNEFIERNKYVIAYYTSISRKFLDSLGEPDHVLVSFSGGKDSLVTLDLAIKHYGKDMVTAIYVDTGVDFEITSKYVDALSSKLGVNTQYVYVPVREYLSIYGYPTRTNRWCTLLKTKGFQKIVEKYKEKFRKLLVLVGDRDSESFKRSRKPPVRKRTGYLEAAPIKQWSTIHVQLYTWINELPENPLYTYGFYRLGCYICPALTSLERYIMINELGFVEKDLYLR